MCTDLSDFYGEMSIFMEMSFWKILSHRLKHKYYIAELQPCAIKRYHVNVLIGNFTVYVSF